MANLFGLLSDDATENQAQRMGLLSLGAAMLGNRTPYLGQALGQGVAAGAQGYQSALENQQAGEMKRLQLADARRKDATERGLLDAAQASILTPEQVAMQGGGGPSIANAARIGSMPGFDMQGFMGRVMGVSPLEGIKLQQLMAKDSPYAKVDPKDYTSASVAKFATTRNYADLVPVRKLDVVNGVATDLYSTPAGTQFDNRDPNQPFWTVGGQVQPNLPYQGFAKAKARAGATSVNVAPDNLGLKPKDRFDMEGKLADDYRAETKLDGGVLSAVRKIKTALANPNALADQATIYSFAKMLDPEGAVRESDYAAIMNTAGLGERMQNYVQKLKTGEQLSPKQRQEMLDVMGRFETVANERINGIRGNYSSRAKSYNLDPKKLFMDAGTESPAKPPRTVVQTGTYQGKKVVKYSDGTTEYAN